MRKVIFLDRDGTLNIDRGYTHKTQHLEFHDKVIDGLKKLTDYELVILTNQSGISRGFYTEDSFKQFTDKLIQELGEEGIMISEVLFCPHVPDHDCECRKPGLGMVDGWVIDKDNSYIIGDKTSDIKFGKNLGIRTILLKTGKAGKDGNFDVEPDFVAEDMLEAADYIISV